jgi:hypothetical protein
MAYTPKGTPPEARQLSPDTCLRRPYILTIGSALFLGGRLCSSDDSCAIFFALLAKTRLHVSLSLLWYDLWSISNCFNDGLGFDSPECTSICCGTFVSIDVSLSNGCIAYTVQLLVRARMVEVENLPVPIVYSSNCVSAE